MEKIVKFVRSEAGAEALRYVIIGGATTLISWAVFGVMERVLGIDTNVSNFVSIVVAVSWAYIANKLFVFRSRCGSGAALVREILDFLAARALTMLLEFGGMFVMHGLLGLDSVFSKVFLTVVVIILNYILSKLVVFKEGKKSA